MFFQHKKVVWRDTRDELKSSQRAVIIFNEKGGKNILLIYAPLYIKWDEIEVI